MNQIINVLFVMILFYDIEQSHKRVFINRTSPIVMMVVYFYIIVILAMISPRNAVRRIIQHFPSSLGDDRYPELSSRLFEGDILMPVQEGTKNAVISSKLKWPNATVIYDFTSNYTESEREKVLKSMNLIEKKTCVKFQKRKSNEAHILINKKARQGCYALIGYRPDMSPIPVNLQSPECMAYPGTIQHELLHVIGLLHEQSRNDRDKYVNILWDNIEEKHYSDFSKALPGSTTAYEIPYNVLSVMHYPNIAFSKNGKNTIESKKDPSMEMGQRIGVTEGDLEKVRRMYDCKTSSGTDSTNTGSNQNNIQNMINIFNIFKP